VVGLEFLGSLSKQTGERGPIWVGGQWSRGAEDPIQLRGPAKGRQGADRGEQGMQALGILARSRLADFDFGLEIPEQQLSPVSASAPA
jgi:hypothetical protein